MRLIMKRYEPFAMQPCRFRSSGKATADVKGVYLRQQNAPSVF